MKWGLWGAVASAATLAGGGVGYLLNQQSGSSAPPVAQMPPPGDMAAPNTQFPTAGMPPPAMPMAQNTAPPPRMVPPPIQTSSAPEMTVIPTNDNKYLYMAAGAGMAGLFFLAGDWYRNHNGHWYRSNAYNGNWAWLDQRYVPGSLVTIYPQRSYYLNTYTQRVPYTVVDRDWRNWERDRHWDKYAWYQSGRQTMATPGLDKRQAVQQQSITQGVRSGQLTQQEAARLQAGQDRVQSMKLQAKADGVVTAQERQQILQAQQIERDKILYERRDQDRANNARPAAPAMQQSPVQQRQVHSPQIPQPQYANTKQLAPKPQPVQPVQQAPVQVARPQSQPPQPARPPVVQQPAPMMRTQPAPQNMAARPQDKNDPHRQRQ